jgi:CDP-diacylglycerol--serine O-phosphatidyltransferase
VPAPAGAVMVMLPVYLVFIGAIVPDRTLGFLSSAFTVLVAFLLVSRLPVYSGKKIRIPGDKVLPLILGVAFFMLLLVTYPWQALSISVLAYMIFLPLSARAYSRRAKAEEEKDTP